MTEQFLNAESARDMTHAALVTIANRTTEEDIRHRKELEELEAKIREEYMILKAKVQKAIVDNAHAGRTSASFIESYPPRVTALLRLAEPLHIAGYGVTSKGSDDMMTIELTVSWAETAAKSSEEKEETTR